MKIKPFAARRPKPDIAARVACPPYDVVDTGEARRLAEGNPNSFFHVSRPDIDLPDGTDPYSPEIYAAAGRAYANLQRRGVLLRDDLPGLYFYRLTWGQHRQTGVFAVCSVDEYDRDLIKKHEKTRAAPEDDRTRHILAVRAHTGPVLLTFRDTPELDALIAEGKRPAPLYDFTAPDGIRHTLWKAEDPDRLVRAFDAVPAAYIADGHHRAAASSRVAREVGGAEARWFLAVLFPAGRLKILPYNRCVRDLNGLGEEQFMNAVRDRFTVRPAADPTPAQPGRVAMRLGETWHELSWSDTAGADPVAALDVSVLQERLLAPVLGIDDPRRNPRIEFVGGIRGIGELEQRVRSGRSAVAFSMYPTTVEQLMAISDAGRTMPPKSTWFEPKLRDGLLCHDLD